VLGEKREAGLREKVSQGIHHSGCPSADLDQQLAAADFAAL